VPGAPGVPGASSASGASGEPGGSGRTLTEADVTTIRLPASAVPSGAIRPGTSIAGRRLAGPMRRGEPFTDARLLRPSRLRPGLLAGQPSGTVATPVRIADAEAAALLTAGDVIDILAGPAEWTPAAAPITQPIAESVTVIRPPTKRPGPADRPEAGALIVLATTPAQAAALAAAQPTGRLSIAIHSRR
jgi:Flp pilus assembly protein CpaB